MTKCKKIIKNNSKYKKIRASDNAKYKSYYDSNKVENLLDITQLNYEAKKNLWKENIDITLEDNYDSFIFELHTNIIEADLNILSYIIRYRIYKGNEVFKIIKLTDNSTKNK